VTPQQEFSYASFECNVLLPTAPTVDQSEIPDLGTLINRVVSIFQPGKLSLTLFISSEHNNSVEDEGGESAIEAAQRVFRLALTSPSETSAPVYKRTDNINYEFGSYDLAFASFELNS
jgi:S-adenosylmethionine decarboxylase